MESLGFWEIDNLMFFIFPIYVLFFGGVVGNFGIPQVPNHHQKKNNDGSCTEICTAVGPNFLEVS